MTPKYQYSFYLIWLVIFSSCQQGSTDRYFDGDPLEVTIRNASNVGLRSQWVTIDLSDKKDLQLLVSGGEIVVQVGDSLDVPFHVNDTDSDLQIDELSVLCDLAPSETKNVKIGRPSKSSKPFTPQRMTYAEIAVKQGGQWVDKYAATGNFQPVYEGGDFVSIDNLKVPQAHRDHSNYIKYEGPGWESDKIGYRLYLDQRNAIDVFGKTTTEMVLAKVGLDGFESYHHMANWGMDIFKVGKSLGIGSLGYWTGNRALRVEDTDSISCEILTQSHFGSGVRISHYGWDLGDNKTNVTATLSITPSSRMTKHHIVLDEKLPNLCTGIIKHANADVILPQALNGGWRYFATYGKQSLNDDNLGLFVIYRDSDIMEITEDEHSYVLVLMPEQQQLTYFFGAAWELEPNGIKTREAFVNYLENLVAQLNAPIEVLSAN